MTKKQTIRKTALAALLTIVALTTGQSAWAQDFTVTNSGNEFTITRTETTTAVTVKYRTVSLSALAGIHFTEASGELIFNVGDEQAAVSVTEASVGDLDVIYRYQTGTSRSYRFEVLSQNDTELAHCDRDIEYGTGYQIELEKFFQKVALAAADVGFGMTVTDSGFGQAYHSFNIASYFTETAPQEYFNAIGTKLGMTFDFRAKEDDDGYQYFQILVDETTNYDADNDKGDVGELHYAQLMAGFAHDPGVKNSDYAYYTFPIPSSGDIPFGCYDNRWKDYGNTVGRLYSQKIKPGYQHGHSGCMLADANLSTLGVRFDASGKHDDDWMVRDFCAHIQAIDECVPTISGEPKVSVGPYTAGSTFYVSVPFSEIVFAKYSPTLTTNWGTLAYVAGHGTNVLTFGGLIDNNADTSAPLTITGLSGKVHDMRGNSFSGTQYINVTFPGCAVSPEWTADGADGTSEKPYLITTVAGLKALAANVNAGNDYGADVNHPGGYYFKLGADIDLSGETLVNEENFTAIGTKNNRFDGIFDGAGYTISGIRIQKTGGDDADNYQALFGCIGIGTVQHVTLEDASIQGKNYVGAIAGSCYGGTISDCFVVESRVEASGSQCGVIVANNSGRLSHNYYLDCRVTDPDNTYNFNIAYYNGTSLADANGEAEEVFLLDHGDLTATGVTLTYNGNDYCAFNTEVTVSYGGEVAEGCNAIKYTFVSPQASINDEVYGLADGYTFLMPQSNMIVGYYPGDCALILLDDDSAQPAGRKNEDYIAAPPSGDIIFVLQDRRLYQDGEWNTLCLPLSADDNALDHYAGATLMELDVTGTYDDDKQTGFDAATGTLYLYFKPANAITAGVPYLIKWGNPEGAPSGYIGTAIDSPYFYATVTSTAPANVQSQDGMVSFTGRYGALTYDADATDILFLGEGNTLYYPQADASVNAFRAYFKLNGLAAGDPANPNYSPIRNYVLNFGNENSNGIEAIDNGPLTIDNEADAWYDLSGRRLTGKPTAKGIYIYKGKKMRK